MEINRETIEVHAQERLDGTAMGADRGAQIEAFKRFLKLETERLRMRHRFGLGGTEIATGRSYQIDLVVTRVCQAAAAAADRVAQRELAQCAVVALGGYGRGELAPYSDVDLLFLHGGRPSEGVKDFVQRALMLLWDIGLSVGHSFRSPRECVSMARQDLHSRTALTEARLITGNATLYQDLLKTLESGLLRDKRATEQFLQSMRVELTERYAKVGGAVCIQEPNVKEGVGGLRDLHAVLWVGHARFGSRGLAGLHAEGWISDAEYVGARRAYDALCRVRNEAHFATGRKTDLLTLDVQPDLAQNLGYKPKGGLLASEIFMRDYYRRASEVHRFSDAFMVRHLSPPPRRLFPGLRRAPRARRGFEVRAGALHARGHGAEMKGGPLQIIEAFATAQAEGVRLSDELKLAITDRLANVTREFRASREASRAFVRLFERRGRVADTVRAMHETGFLGRFFPEWARITFLVQHDFFHRYTVDEHTLKCLEALDDLAAGTGVARLGNVFDEVKDATPLYLGMLLHDIGKGRGGGHVSRGVRIGARILDRVHADAALAEDVLFLIDAHLDMSQLSQQRDITEPSLIEGFAKRVSSLERLNLLFLLTCADHCGVGPGIWNEWKASLLSELYGRTRERLLGQTQSVPAGHASQVRAMKALLPDFPAEELERHFAMLPERYLRATDAARMERHFRLLKSLGDGAVAVEWRDLDDGQCTELTVAASHDRPGLFAALAGTLTAQGVNILAVDLFTREDGRVLDTFRVSEQSGNRPVREERQARIEASVIEAVTGRLEVEGAVDRWRTRTPSRARRHWGRAAKGPVVRFDNESSAAATVVEVRAQDQPGLAYTIADALAELGLDITFAKIATAKALALDVFYVTDAHKRKLSPEALPAIEQALLRALGTRPKKNPTKEAE
jgi:[protein-PII] uridylyltransferase